MDLRTGLTPPKLDEANVAQLAEIADRLDQGCMDGRCDDSSQRDLALFNQLAGTNLFYRDFQGRYGAEDRQTWVRRILRKQRIKLVLGATKAELVEVARRAMDLNGRPVEECDAYGMILDAHLPGAFNLIYWPPGFDENTWTWEGGRDIAEWEPSPEKIVDIVWGLGHFW